MQWVPAQPVSHTNQGAAPGQAVAATQAAGKADAWVMPFTFCLLRGLLSFLLLSEINWNIL